MIKHYNASKVSVQTSATSLKKNQPRRTITTLIAEPNVLGRGAQFIITEQEYTPRPERQWTTCAKTLHLTLKANATHIQLQGYIRRADLINNAALSDTLAREIEQIADVIEDMEDLSHE